MIFSYYPGCTLKTKAKELDIYARKSAEALGVTMEELENWQCCGGVYPLGTDEIASKLSSVRALSEAAKREQILVTVCSACHNVIKQTNHAMQNDKAFADKVNRYMAEDGGYHGEAQVYHYLEMLRDLVGFEKVKEKVVNSQKGKKIAAYYGCLLLRPNKVMRMDDNLELVESLDFYEDNNIMIKVLYKQYYLFEVGMLLPSERITDNWGYMDLMWVFCEDGSKFG